MGFLKALLLLGIVVQEVASIPWYKVDTASNKIMFQQDDPDLITKWQHFIHAHSKQYTSTEEESRRREIFSKNLRIIHEHNNEYEKGLQSYQMGINKFTDMEYEEVSSMVNGFKASGQPAEGVTTYLPPSTPVRLPDTVDWRTKGYVTPVKNQEQCGSCWAFGATGTLEGQHFRKTKKLVSLSEQNLVDCATEPPDQGCQGGLPRVALHYVTDNHGIDTEEAYPYEGKNGKCRYKNSTQAIGATCTGIVALPAGNESALQQATAMIGPISVGICAGGKFMYYTQGVFNDPQCCTSLNHAVLVVGYGVDDTTGLKYWLVKNSWDTSWGEKGYVRMRRDAGNQCGIATEAVYPLV